MLEIIEQKMGTLEFTDQSHIHDWHLERIKVISVLSFAFIIAMVTILIEITFIVKLGLILFIIAISVTWVIRIGWENLKEFEIQGFTLHIQDETVLEMTVNYWNSKWFDAIRLERVRFNQAVGFMISIQENAIIEVSVIVHEQYPGDLIFETRYMDTVADLIGCFKIIFPNMEELYFTYEDGATWDDEDLDEWNSYSSSTRIPSILRNYFKI